MDECDKEIVKQIILLARDDPNFVLSKNKPTYWDGITPIRYEGKIVGFYSRRFMKNVGRFNNGPIYVMPEYRGKGIASHIFANSPLPASAFVIDGAKDSEATVKKAGYFKFRKIPGYVEWRKDR